MTEPCLFIVMEAGRCWPGCSFQGLSPWLADGLFLPVSSEHLTVCVSVLASFSYYAKGLKSTLRASVSLDYPFKGFVSKYY